MVIDFWKITLRARANLLAANCNILAGTSSGPVDLFVFNSFSHLATPFVVMVMSGIAGTFEYASFGKLVFSFVKTDLNWSLRISALSLLSDSVCWSLVRVGILIVCTFRQNRFAESEQINAMYRLWAFLVFVCAFCMRYKIVHDWLDLCVFYGC